MLTFHIENVTHQFTQKPLFSNISQTLKNPQTVAIIGENGVGKTTLLGILAQMVTPSFGKVRVEMMGKPLLKQQFFKQAGVSFTDNYLLNDCTLEENLKLFSQFYPTIDPQRSKQLLELFDIGHLRHKICRHFSEGERKKLSLIRALMIMPSFLFLDEPTNALDQGSKEILKRWIKEQNVFCFFTTHDQDWANQLATQTWHLSKGFLHVS